MSYTINKTDGSILAVVSDGTINSDTSLTIVGMNYAGYGAFLGENFVRLLENGANFTAPANPLEGELWFDKSAGLLKVFNGTIFKNLGAATADSVAPTSPVTGDLWFDTGNKQLNVYDGAAWILVGPAFTGAEGTSGAIVDTITDNLSTDHVVVKLYVENVVVAVVSKDAPFTVGTPFGGFTGTISPGIQLADSLVGGTPTFIGKSSDSALFDGDPSSTFLRSNANDTTSGTLGVLNDSGVTVGLNSDMRMYVENTIGSDDIVLQNVNAGGRILIRAQGVGGPVDAIIIKTGQVRAQVHQPVDDDDIANKIWTTNEIVSQTTNMLKDDGTVTIKDVIYPSLDLAYDFGKITNRFQTIYADTFNGRATTAQYADLAERYEADQPYEPGTVVMIGGEKEITMVTKDLTEDVFGVISSDPGFIMNNEAGSDITHPKVAMTGRVPVNVIGKIQKGKRLVSAGNGLARQALDGEATCFNVIGRALEDKVDEAVGKVLAVVNIQI